MASQELLIRSASEFARSLAATPGISDVLTDLAERAAAVLGVAGAGVSVPESGGFRFAAASDERAASLERAQEAGQAGPCVDACLTGKAVTVADVSRAERGWGACEQAARDAGIVAVASVPICHAGQCIGTLDLYSTARRNWSADDLAAAGLLADIATSYLVHSRELDQQGRVNEQLREALHSRIVIEQAKGVLAAERRISVDEAFEVLRRHARSHSVSLHSVAEAVVGLRLRP